MLRFASSKGKGGTLTTHTRRTPDSPARTPLTKGDRRCLAISLTCGTVIENTVDSRNLIARRASAEKRETGEGEEIARPPRTDSKKYMVIM